LLIVVQYSLLCHSYCLDDCVKKNDFLLEKISFCLFGLELGFWCYSYAVISEIETC